MKRLIVIGSNSFSGAHFVSKSIEDGFEVLGVSRSIEISKEFLPYYWENSSYSSFLVHQTNFNFHQININNDLYKLLTLIDDFKPLYVINFAAQGMVAESWINPTHWYQTNVVSQVAFHDELRKREFIEKYVHVTTPEVYGSTDKGWIKENNYFNPTTPYAISRACCDMHLESFYKAYEFPVVFTRAANVYGPGQQLYRIIPRTILSAKTGKKIKLHGGGYSERSFVHIKDVVDATMRIMLDSPPGKTWHISSEKSITIRELVKMIFSTMNVNFEDLVEDDKERLGKDQSYLLDSCSLRKELNWTDSISLDHGLNDTINWIESNLITLSKMSWKYEHKI